MIRRPPRSTLSSSSAASDVYKRQEKEGHKLAGHFVQTKPMRGISVQVADKCIAVLNQTEPSASLVPLVDPKRSGAVVRRQVNKKNTNVGAPRRSPRVPHPPHSNPRERAKASPREGARMSALPPARRAHPKAFSTLAIPLHV
eukprot:TRINITY_DN21840_c0_g1_i2.p1 TRINITY_DN21840_c0_g1~~TRINITY_DN21840_c0_g1_i2.p1  ORF type:complete len:143 (+),score=15.51 TRINITY_DN21840_c0_g1_i2:150-578(+)